MDDTWVCPRCHSKNKPSLDRCFTCRTERPKSDAGPAPEPTAPPAAEVAAAAEPTTPAEPAGEANVARVGGGCALPALLLLVTAVVAATRAR